MNTDIDPSFPTVAEFEAAAIDPEAFTHEAHVYIAWHLLLESPFPVAGQRFTAALRKIVTRFGFESKYHETISWFYMQIIAERQSQQDHTSWSEFARCNPDLTGSSKELLGNYYTDERLFSPLARRQYLLPDVAQKAAA